jgi:hypothetical protein
MKRTFMTAAIAATALAFAALTAGTALAAVSKLRIRGTIVSMDGSTLTVKTREGATTKIALKAGWKVSGVAKALVTDVKAGDYVGIASMPKANAADSALEVVIFPAALKGAGEGSRPWDLKPKSSMTNGTVADTVKSVEGKTLTISYHGQEKKISITDKIPIVTFAPATEADLKAGATVFINSEKAEDGTISSDRIVVGKNGVVPPM